MDGTTTEIDWNQCTPVTSEQNNRFKADFVAYNNLSMYRSEEKSLIVNGWLIALVFL